MCFLGKHSKEFPKKIGRLVINYFLHKLLVAYGIAPSRFRRQNSRALLESWKVKHNLLVRCWNSNKLLQLKIDFSNTCVMVCDLTYKFESCKQHSQNFKHSTPCLQHSSCNGEEYGPTPTFDLHVNHLEGHIGVANFNMHPSFIGAPPARCQVVQANH